MAMLEEEELKDAILLVFANKQDSPGALNSRHVRSTAYFVWKLICWIDWFMPSLLIVDTKLIHTLSHSAL